MKALLLALLLAGIFAEEMLVTKEYTDYLKRHVSWEVVDYEENTFRGWTMEEAKMFLGAVLPEETQYVPHATVKKNLPASLDWSAGNCDHGVRNQANCGSCWAFAVTGMLSDRCCLQGNDHGWLAPQELVSCDKTSHGCSGGWCTWALNYVMSAKGLVHEACFPYRASNMPCPSTCADGKDWKSSHVCDCKGGYKKCVGVDQVKSCLSTGPVAVAFGVCRSFFNYKNGIYKCDCGGNYVGLHAVLAMGYTDTPECNYHVRNSWGPAWGDQGYFNIACDQCGMSGTYPEGNVMCEKVQ